MRDSPIKKYKYSQWLFAPGVHISEAMKQFAPIVDRLDYITTSCYSADFFDIDSTADRALLRSFLIDNNIRGDWLHAPFGPESDLVSITDDACFARHITSIEVAAECGFDHVVFHGGIAPDEPTFLKRLEASLERLLPHTDRAGVTFALEVPTGPLSLIDGFIELKEKFGDPALALCLDTGHANCWPIGVDFKTIARKCLPLSACLHVHDNNGTTDQHLPPGEGKIPWDWFIDEMIEVGYDGVIAGECEPPPGWTADDLYNRCHEIFARVL